MATPIEQTAANAANLAARRTADLTERGVRIPANLMSLLRQSYDSREKVLDWMLAFAVAGCVVWAFREELMGLVIPPVTANAGRAAPPQPNQDVRGVFPYGGRGADLYTYNMPVSRTIRDSVIPSGTRPPLSPDYPAAFSHEDDDQPFNKGFSEP